MRRGIAMTPSADTIGVLANLPPAAVSLSLLVVVLIAVEAGFRIGRRNPRRYLDLRIALYRSKSPHVWSHTNEELSALQPQLWALATMAPMSEPVSSHTILLTTTMNDVFDLAAEQTVALAEGIPPTIVFLLFVVVAISGWLLGYGFGRSGKRDRISSLTFALLVCFVTYAIIDLSEAQRGLIRTNDAALSDLRATRAPPAP
jgi:hypothetical protein